MPPENPAIKKLFIVEPEEIETRHGVVLYSPCSIGPNAKWKRISAEGLEGESLVRIDMPEADPRLKSVRADTLKAISTSIPWSFSIKKTEEELKRQEPETGNLVTNPKNFAHLRWAMDTSGAEFDNRFSRNPNPIPPEPQRNELTNEEIISIRQLVEANKEITEADIQALEIQGLSSLSDLQKILNTDNKQLPKLIDIITNQRNEISAIFEWATNYQMCRGHGGGEETQNEHRVAVPMTKEDAVFVITKLSDGVKAQLEKWGVADMKNQALEREGLDSQSLEARRAIVVTAALEAAGLDRETLRTQLATFDTAWATTHKKAWEQGPGSAHQKTFEEIAAKQQELLDSSKSLNPKI